MLTNQKKEEFKNLDEMLEMLKKEKNYKQALKYGSNNYNIAQYKINKLKLEQIPQMVNLIEVNYINLEKETDPNAQKKKNSWLANELKLFVWMAVCHSYLHKKPLEQYEQQQWPFFTDIFSRKTWHDLDFQAKSIFKNYKGNKQKWQPQQQNLLKTIIDDQNYNNKWNEISRILYFKSNKKYYRSSQKCRQYWFNHLDDRLNKSPWTVDEDIRLIGELLVHGFKWSKLTQVIESNWGYRRTQHMVKNRTKLLCKKYGYKDEKQQGCTKELKMIERKLRQEKTRMQSLPSIQVKQQESVQQKSFTLVQTQNKGQGKKIFDLKDKDFNEKKQETEAGSHDNLKQIIGMKDRLFNNLNGKVHSNLENQTCKQKKVIKKQQKFQFLQPKDCEINKKIQKNFQQSSSSQSYDSRDESQSQVESGWQRKKKIIKKDIMSRKAKRPIIVNQEQKKQILQQQEPNSNKRQVIILYQAGSNKKQEEIVSSIDSQSQVQEQQKYKKKKKTQQVESQESQSSSQVIIGRHVEEDKNDFNRFDEQEDLEQNNNKEDSYFDEYNIVEEVPDQQIDLNEDIQFQHDTHGGKMRQRVTHQLAKYFPNQQN